MEGLVSYCFFSCKLSTRCIPVSPEHTGVPPSSSPPKVFSDSPLTLDPSPSCRLCVSTLPWTSLHTCRRPPPSFVVLRSPVLLPPTNVSTFEPLSKVHPFSGLLTSNSVSSSLPTFIVAVPQCRYPSCPLVSFLPFKSLGFWSITSKYGRSSFSTIPPLSSRLFVGTPAVLVLPSFPTPTRTGERKVKLPELLPPS